MTADDDKKFLIKQREKDRPGFMYNVSDQYMLDTEEESELMETDQSFLETDEEQEMVIHDFSLDEPGPSQSKQRRLHGTENIITSKIVAALDACKMSDRCGVRILTAVAEALGHDTLSLSISRSTFQRCGQVIRAERATQLKNAFQENELSPLIVYWDGKLLPSLTDMENVDRLPVLVTSGDTDQLLGVPSLPNSTGQEQAKAVYAVLSEWILKDKVIAFYCDTTASNMDYLNGAAIILQNMLERDLLYLPCRHHICEIVLRSVFDVKMLSKLFLEEHPTCMSFYRPGAFHHARWMSKAIYCLKIYFFKISLSELQRKRKPFTIYVCSL